jgi:hypothetical protein
MVKSNWFIAPASEPGYLALSHFLKYIL